jgi:hypothetical protein
MVALYGQEIYQEALNNLSGDGLFDDLAELDERLVNVHTHHALLHVYKSLQKVKSAFYDKLY